MIHGCNHKATFLPSYYLTLFSVGLAVTCCWIKIWAVLFALRLRNHTVVTLDRKTQFQFNNHEYSSHVTKKNPDLDLKLTLLFPSRSLARRSLQSWEVNVVGISSLSFTLRTQHLLLCTLHFSKIESLVFPQCPTLFYTSILLMVHSTWITLLFLVHLGDSYLTFNTSLDISPASIPFLQLHYQQPRWQ